jgi:hypothetical protein
MDMLVRLKWMLELLGWAPGLVVGRTYIHEQHNNSVNSDKSRQAVHFIPELDLFEDAVVQREDAGFDEE